MDAKAIHFGADPSLQPILSHNILIQRGEVAGAVGGDPDETRGPRCQRLCLAVLSDALRVYLKHGLAYNEAAYRLETPSGICLNRYVVSGAKD
jgi:hypothetical protein